MLDHINGNRQKYIEALIEHNNENHAAEIRQAKKTISKSEKRIAELDKLFIRIYEDNVSGKISNERFEMMSTSYETEQKQLKANVAELKKFIGNRQIPCTP